MNNDNSFKSFDEVFPEDEFITKPIIESVSHNINDVTVKETEDKTEYVGEAENFHKSSFSPSGYNYIPSALNSNEKQRYTLKEIIGL